MHVHRLLTGPHSAVSYGLDIRGLSMPSVRDCLYKLAIHVVDQSLHILALSRGQLPGGISGVFELAHLEDFALQFGPAHQIAVIYPFGDHADRAYDTAVIRINLVGGGRYVIRSAGANRLDR